MQDSRVTALLIISQNSQSIPPSLFVSLGFSLYRYSFQGLVVRSLGTDKKLWRDEVIKIFDGFIVLTSFPVVMAKSGHGSALRLIFAFVAVLAILSTLGVSIAALVFVTKIYNNQNTYGPQVVNNLNLPAPNEVPSTDPKFSSYNDVVQLFKQSLNVNADPCNDFYAYTCGAFNGDMGFDVSDNINAANMASQLTNTEYIATAPRPVQQTAWFFNACVNALQNWNQLVADGAQVTNAINRYAAGLPGSFASQTQFPFPMLNQNKDVTKWPSPIGLGYLIGQLAGFEGILTLISPYVDTNWKDPTGPDGFAFYLDQPTTFLPYTYYIKNWASSKASLTSRITATMQLLAQVQKVKLNNATLSKDVADIVQLDYLLATKYSTDETTRRQYERSYNPNTISQLNSAYPSVSWHTLIPLSTGPAENATAKVLMPTKKGTPYNFFIVMEPVQLQKLLAALVDGNPDGITPRALVNYFYYRLVDAYSDYLPWPSSASESVRSRVAIVKGHLGKPKHVVPEKQKAAKRQIDDISAAQTNCAFQTVDMMMYANARVLIDKIYPDNSSRVNVREHVAKVASSIVIGFRSMIDQLNWMTPATKRGAYSKIDNLVKNIAYPDWITDDAALTAYHQQLTINKTDAYFDMVYNANQFNIFVSFDQLVQGAADRTGFNGPPGVTNAWYQPELNSITFPAGILKQPFYDYNWPSAVNFGAMGVIAGHELTHGFDDEGVQWDGVGALAGWMDAQSKANFTSMAQCVVNEYSGFCPLDKSKYGAAACIDGAQTQGENIADNGGIHSAFRAYRNYINLYGADPELPDSQFKSFTADQLFFLAFAQVWCQVNPSDAAMERQILVDVHSPSIYRVWGTIQNFPAFKNAFNCPVSKYAPDNHCNVWVSDIDTTFGKPDIKTDLNIVDTPKITSRDVDKYNAFKSAVDYYQSSVNVSVDPCQDFWSYACGSFDKPVSFTTARAQNLVYMANQLQLPSYQSTIKNSTALTKEKMFFDACLVATKTAQTEDQLLIANNYILKKVNKLAGILGQNFSLVFNNKVSAMPTAAQLGDALGYLSFEEGVDTFVTPSVDTNWIDNTKGYRMFVDQNTAYLSKTYYQPAAWVIEKPKYLATALDVVQRFSKQEGGKKRPGNKIALNFSTDDDTRRTFNRSWNLQAVSSLNGRYPFVDWDKYLAHVPTIARNIASAQTYQISFVEPVMIKTLSDAFSKFDATTVVNYLFLRLLLGNAQYIPSYASAFANMHEESILLGLSRRKTIPNFRFPPAADNAPNGPGCAGAANNLMQYANGRVFVDYMYPKPSDVVNIRTVAGGIIRNVINAFQGMIDQLDWMTPDTKKIAYDKTVNVLQNIAFPDWIRNDSSLDAYYKDLSIVKTDNYYDIYDKLVKYNILIQYRQLTFATTDRNDFLGQPGTVNAWYQPELNSITFPAGILVPPYFHPLWPPSINYGGMGLVAGHELTHGFDDQGIQWDKTGNLNVWMDKNSTDGFKNMAQCVINEYNQFCPLNATNYHPNCVKGSQTQGENIADNGGIHSAFRAYRTHLALDGPDPLLPDRLLGQFTHDQLFFLNFAQVWCEVRRTDDALYSQIMNDPHSPSMYRVYGTIQNYPAFQTAFNCPTGSPYAPTKHCDVWSCSQVGATLAEAAPTRPRRAPERPGPRSALTANSQLRCKVNGARGGFRSRKEYPATTEGAVAPAKKQTVWRRVFLGVFHVLSIQNMLFLKILFLVTGFSVPVAANSDWDHYDDEDLALSIPADAVGVPAQYRNIVLKQQKERNKKKDVLENRCHCTYGDGICDGNFTCIKQDNAACYHAVEEVFNKGLRRMETWHKFGCATLERGSSASHLTCNSWRTAHRHAKSIACCYEGNYCNKDLEPPPYAGIYEHDLPGSEFEFEMKNRHGLMIFFVVLGSFVAISLIVFSLLLFLQRLRKSEVHDFKDEEKSAMLEPEDSGSGSGSGKATLIQRTVAQDLAIIKVIGRGRYGEVRKATYRGSYVAVKTFYTTEEDSWKNERDVYQTHMLNHENILQFVAADICSEDSITQMLLVTDYHELGSLSDYLRREETLSTDEALRLIYSSMCGIEHLHTAVHGTGSRRKPEIAHRDIKSKNIIVKRAGVCCIADFGLAVRFENEGLLPEKVNVQVGTKRYMAPEVLSRTLNPNDFSQFKMADIYSFALVMWEIARRVEDNTSAQKAEEFSAGDAHECCESSGLGESLSSDSNPPRLHRQKPSVDISLKAKPYVPPFEGMVENDPSFDEMRYVVCELQKRPPLEDAWVKGNNSALCHLTKLMRDCWEKSPQSRHTALKIKKDVLKLIEEEDKKNSQKLSLPFANSVTRPDADSGFKETAS
ncbi:unnamed protein product [Caenorhabditis auriculariae]|uniref:Guanylate cyclase n=1 Tax=Caenorhabditis auriculariae TaxID=2777116 RepID=A0A8S1H9A6_9PELO|nr:unnamed protein product [Caenorhabditis auriculariae]